MGDFEVAVTILYLGWVVSWFVEQLGIRLWQLRDQRREFVKDT